MMTNGAVWGGRAVAAAPFEIPVDALHRAFQQAGPFRYVVMDGFLDRAVARDLAAEFPVLSDTRWKHREHLHSKKLTLDRLSPTGRVVVEALHSPEMLDWLEVVTGLRDLTGDPSLFGGGLHCVPRGGFLDVHADFSRHPVTGDQRVLNLLIYLNEDWHWLWGGDLELWNADVTACAQRIPLVFNRAVLFETHDRSFHGHPAPLQCPSHVGRKSLALYYYRPRGAGDPFVPTTDYRPRPWEYGKRLRKFVGRTLRRVA